MKTNKQKQTDELKSDRSAPTCSPSGIKGERISCPVEIERRLSKMFRNKPCLDEKQMRRLHESGAMWLTY